MWLTQCAGGTAKTKATVYNVTKFLEDHPGGKDIILEEAGQDATAVFEEAAHSSEARDILASLLVGPLKEHQQANAVQSFDALHAKGRATTASSTRPGGAEFSWKRVATPALLSALMVVWWYGRDRVAGEARQSASVGATGAPWWWSIAVVLCIVLSGVFSRFVSHVIYVDFGRLEKYPSRVSID